jgi:hypothetical protein
MSFLAAQLEHFGQDVRAEGWEAQPDFSVLSRDVAEMVATAIHLLDRVEAAAAKSQPARPDWDEARAREFVPIFNVWFEHATAVLMRVRECTARGEPIEGATEFIHRYNAAKLLSVEFERTAALHASREIGRHGFSLDEVADALQRRGRTGGG